MCRLCAFFNSSLGKKYLVGAAGFLLSAFVLVHLAENLLIFAGERYFNAYATTLESLPILPLLEWGLFAVFFLHIVVSLWARVQNKQARPVGYEVYQDKGGRTIGSKTMLWTALLVLAFLFVHVKTVRFGDMSDGVYKLLVGLFRSPLYLGFYLVALWALALHLSHGVQSMFQTFGINHPKYTRAIKGLSKVFGFVIASGFSAIAIYLHMQGAR